MTHTDDGFRIDDYLLGPCPYCGGLGHAFDDAALGRELRRQRLQFRLQAKDVAAAMRVMDHTISPQYLHDLEQGRRPWRPDLLARYRTALRRLEAES